MEHQPQATPVTCRPRRAAASDPEARQPPNKGVQVGRDMSHAPSAAMQPKLDQTPLDHTTPRLPLSINCNPQSIPRNAAEAVTAAAREASHQGAFGRAVSRGASPSQRSSGNASLASASSGSDAHAAESPSSAPGRPPRRSDASPMLLPITSTDSSMPPPPPSAPTATSAHRHRGAGRAAAAMPNFAPQQNTTCSVSGRGPSGGVADSGSWQFAQSVPGGVSLNTTSMSLSPDDQDAAVAAANKAALIMPMAGAAVAPPPPPPGFVAVRSPAGTNVLHAPTTAVLAEQRQIVAAKSCAPPLGGVLPELRLCPLCLGTSTCPRGADCPFVHVDPRLVAPAGSHLNLAWPSLEDVTYPRFDGTIGAALPVAAPGSRNIIDTIAPQMLLRTGALEATRRPLTHCAHYYFNRVCERGAGCRFIHAVFVDPTATTLKRAPAPVQMGRPHRDRLRAGGVRGGRAASAVDAPADAPYHTAVGERAQLQPRDAAVRGHGMRPNAQQQHQPVTSAQQQGAGDRRGAERVRQNDGVRRNRYAGSPAAPPRSAHAGFFAPARHGNAPWLPPPQQLESGEGDMHFQQQQHQHDADGRLLYRHSPYHGVAVVKS